MIVQEPVEAVIWHCLNHYAYSDAIFLAERLYAEVDTDEALFLLATCYYRSGKPKQAYSLLHIKGCRSPQCKYLFARCCLDLDKLSEAESTLSGASVLKVKARDEISDFGDATCFAIQLLARIYGRTERLGKASDLYKKSLKLNPFLWSSYASLCNMGERVDPSKVFQLSHLDNLNGCQGTNFHMQQRGENTITNNEFADLSSENIIPPVCQPLRCSVSKSPVLGVHRRIQEIIYEEVTPQNKQLSSPPAMRYKFSVDARNLFKTPMSLSPLSPNFGRAVVTSTPIDSRIVEQKSVGRKSVITKSSVFSQSRNTGNMTRLTQVAPSPSFSLFSLPMNPNTRRNSRLYSTSNSLNENNESSSKCRFSSPKTPPRKIKHRSSKNSKNNSGVTPSNCNQQFINIQKGAADGLMQLMQHLGEAYLSLTQFNCRTAVEILTSLSIHHVNTGWVLGHLGRAHFELSEYQQAVNYFADQMKLTPYCLEGLEYYSTALWHLQKEVELSTLAQELRENHEESGEAACAAGNCFSLQKKHSTAIEFFQRAVQVEPNFAYAHTLLGHEYGITEEPDEAMSHFRKAIRIDPRHYNAWYGIGMIYYRQENFRFAEFHLNKALLINPQSSVLMCQIAVVQQALQKTDLALSTLNRAISTDPKNPLSRIHRASIYFANDRHADALIELMELKELVPKESSVYYLTGKVHEKLGNTHLALMNFSWAKDLDPKGANNKEINRRYIYEDAESTAEEKNGEELSQKGSVMDAEEAQQLQSMESNVSL